MVSKQGPRTPADDRSDTPQTAAESAGERASAEEEARIVAAMVQLRDGVRRQRAATAALDAARRQMPPGGGGLSLIAELREPVCTSGVPIFGRLIVLARRAMLKLFFGWYIRPILQQQSRFNQALAQHLGSLVDAQRALRRDLEALDVRETSGASGQETPSGSSDVGEAS